MAKIKLLKKPHDMVIFFDIAKKKLSIFELNRRFL